MNTAQPCSIQTAYTNLLHTSVEFTPPAPAPLTAPQAARVFVAYTRKHGPLPTLGAWRLHPAYARLLHREAHGQPTGGWIALAGVLAGTPLIELTDDGFVTTTAQSMVDAMSDGDIEQLLIEVLTVRMAPPTAAAGLFILMGINPVAGLQLARIIHQSSVWGQRHSAEHLATLYHHIEAAGLTPLASCFFGATSAILEVVSSMDTQRAYSGDKLAALVLTIIQHQAAQLDQQLCERQRAQVLTPPGPGLNDSEHMERALDFTHLDLLDGFLIPAGLVHRIQGGLFCVHPAARSACFDTITLCTAQERADHFAQLLAGAHTLAA